MKRISARVATEAEEQEALFEWAERAKRAHPALELMFHIPNGGSRNMLEAANLKRQGVKPGVPDICLPVPRGKFAALFIEMKRRKGYVISEAQRGWIMALNRAGCRAVVCMGWDEARETILEYLKGGGGKAR